MTVLLRDLGRAIARGLPARNLAVINAHGGNRGILEAVAQDIRADFGLNVCILNPTALAGLDAQTGIPDIHAGRIETSMMLAVAPHLVRPDLLAQLKKPPAPDAVARTILQDGVTWLWTSNDERIADMGVIGDPASASAELGQELVARVVETTGNVLRDFLNNQRSRGGAE
jgi:creatinine amidohydrolase/Fe(II)-dependent formamide hydrolase-like protein